MKTFTSSRGIPLTLRAVSQFKIDSLRASKKEVPVPTYKVSVVGGDEQEYPLDETIAKNKDRLDEWNAYLEKRKAEDASFSKKFVDFLIWEGVDIAVPDQDSDWQKSNQHFGIDTPDDPIDRKVLYVYNEMLGPAEDISDLIAEILSASKLINEEAVSTLRDSFRNRVQQQADSIMPTSEGPVEDEKPGMEPIGSLSLLEHQAV